MIGSNETTSVGGNQSIDVGAIALHKIGGAQSISVGGNDTTNANGNYVEKVGGNRDYTVGGNQIAISNGVKHDHHRGPEPQGRRAAGRPAAWARSTTTPRRRLTETVGAVKVQLIKGSAARTSTARRTRPRWRRSSTS